jgi:hypothetical protein
LSSAKSFKFVLLVCEARAFSVPTFTFCSPASAVIAPAKRSRTLSPKMVTTPMAAMAIAR